eukprot:1949420-Rhodomonas_salina.1
MIGRVMESGVKVVERCGRCVAGAAPSEAVRSARKLAESEPKSEAQVRSPDSIRARVFWPVQHLRKLAWGAAGQDHKVVLHRAARSTATVGKAGERRQAEL